MSMQVVKPGLFSTLQDMGRKGYQQYGIPVSGAMDTWSYRMANLLAGNLEDVPAIEFTLTGPEVVFLQDVVFVVTGARTEPRCNGQPVPTWRPVFAEKGSRLQIGPCLAGARGYLAVSGGFDEPSVLGSASTYVKAELGGCNGKPLQAGNVLSFGQPSRLTLGGRSFLAHEAKGRGWSAFRWSLSPECRPSLGQSYTIRAMDGPHATQFTTDSLERFWTESFSVTSQSDRMGFRLDGSPLFRLNAIDMLSAGVAWGTVQVPPDGKPIVLMADRQTTGGYPIIAQVASVDLPLVAQARPGDLLRFTRISQRQAEQWLWERERMFLQLKSSIQGEWKKYENNRFEL